MFLTLRYSIAALSVFSRLRETPLIAAFENLLDAGAKAAQPQLDAAWAKFTMNLAESGSPSFYTAIYEFVRRDENPWTLAAERGEKSALLDALAEGDLQTLKNAACFDFSRLRSLGAERLSAEYGLVQPKKQYPPDDFSISRLSLDIRQNGAGIFSNNTMFRWDGASGALVPAFAADPVRFSDLSGYTDERGIVLENTLRFLKGRENGAYPANNLLLYGDRGTGKSAAVKAVCNELADKGLRLVEVKKEDFKELPSITEALRRRGLFFILFIDDLSFEKQDDSFTMLKALLEGGVERRPANVVVYATSNRRHFVKENFAERPAGAGDVRAFDTMQEQLSLSDRFGLTVIFTSPNQDDYLEIAEFLARKRGMLAQAAVSAEEKAKLNEFRGNALKWERWFNGRSPRTACQFVDWCTNGGLFPWD
ncbi:MAG: ATP-binding protein [Spirochaetaceae bacterium]|nr:ATP-binding protein [Spirochaetaceae bacterium]